jgi:nucleotide-binding universal stress UspA family protein
VSIALTRVRRAQETGQDPFIERILLASEGRPFSKAAIARTVELARPEGASVHVFTIARVYGVAFGLQTPGLRPSKAEWKERHAEVAAAVKALKKNGVSAEGHVLGTRKSTRRILDEASKEGCDAIVMGADPDRFRIISDMLWEQEPQRVRRRAKIPVFLVVDE